MPQTDSYGTGRDFAVEPSIGNATTAVSWLIEPLDDCDLSSVNDFSMFGLITCGGPAESPIPESSGAGVTRLVALNNSMHSFKDELP